MYYSDGLSLSYFYDWINPEKNSTPEDYPFSFDAFYLWRDFDKHNKPNGLDIIYTDRMYQWDYDKATKAFEGYRDIRNLTKDDCMMIAKKYFGNETQCIGYALCCNASNGYPIGMFIIR